MTEKRLYALNESDVVKLTKLAKGFEAVSTRLGHLDDVRLNRGFIASLVPVDRDAAVERMARGLMEHWRDMHTNEALGQQRMLARAALAALLGGSNPEDRTYTREDMARAWPKLERIPDDVWAVTDADGDVIRRVALDNRLVWKYEAERYEDIAISNVLAPFTEVLENE